MDRILVVDDSAFDLRIAERILEKQGRWEIHTAGDGREALERLAEQAFDVVLSDVQMPVMNGLELLKKVGERFPALPLVIVTSRGSEELAVEALQNGAASYLSKSSLKNDLERVLRSVLSAASHDRVQSRLLRHLTRGEFEFSLPNDRDLLFGVIRFLQEAAGQLGILDETEWTRLGIALEESLANAMIHGNLEVSSNLREGDDGAYDKLIAMRKEKTPYRDRRVYVTARFLSDEVEFAIRDEGPGFDPAKIPDPTDPENLSRPHGRGLFMIYQFMDHVRHNETGNEITLIKRRRKETADAEPPALEPVEVS